MRKLIALAAGLALLSSTAVAQINPQTGRYVDADGHVQNIIGVSTFADQRTFTLASNQTLAAGACGSPVLVDVSAQYGWLNQIVTGTSPSITLKFRGPDGGTYLTSTYVATATGSQFVPITAGSVGSYVEACNTGSNPVTLYSTLSS